MAKYVDLPVPEGRAFVFWRDGLLDGRRARTLREFVSVVEQWPVKALDGHLRRGDFSRWIADVFGDYSLAKTVRLLEQDYPARGAFDIAVRLVQAVRTRYELGDALADSSGPNPLLPA
jgi:hypothetical protein